MSSRPALSRGLTLAQRLLAASDIDRVGRKRPYLVPLIAGSERRHKLVPEVVTPVSSSGLALRSVALQSRERALEVAKVLQVDVVVTADSTEFVDRQLPKDTPDEMARTFGESLVDQLPSRAIGSILTWSSINRPGWRQGGELSLTCNRCSSPLTWWDWNHPLAPRGYDRSLYTPVFPQSSRHFTIFCPTHGGQVIHMQRTDGFMDLMNARRVLDSLLWAKGGTKSNWQVYAFELHGLDGKHVYVGQTSKSVDERMEAHADPERAVHIVKRGATVGPLLPIPVLPPLTHLRTALAAERWVAAHFEFRGYEVHGDGRR